MAAYPVKVLNLYWYLFSAAELIYLNINLIWKILLI